MTVLTYTVISQCIRRTVSHRCPARNLSPMTVIKQGQTLLESRLPIPEVCSPPMLFSFSGRGRALLFGGPVHQYSGSEHGSDFDHRDLCRCRVLSASTTDPQRTCARLSRGEGHSPGQATQWSTVDQPSPRTSHRGRKMYCLTVHGAGFNATDGSTASTRPIPKRSPFMADIPDAVTPTLTSESRK